MDQLKKTAKRDEIAARAAASPASLGMWRYASVLPDVTPVTLGEGWTPMLHSKRYPGLYIKEEGANPTGTFKARGLALAVTMARHYGLRKLAAPTAGNAGGANPSQFNPERFLAKDGKEPETEPRTMCFGFGRR